MKKRRWIFGVVLFIALYAAGLWSFKRFNFNTGYTVGQPIDSLNGVKVYHNGGVNHVSGRNVTKDKYNLGLKYQCVEFVKRYYYEHFGHKMPDSYGHAKDFFDPGVKDGSVNKKRGLRQYHNPSKSRPEVSDLVIFSGTVFNRYGHVAIVSKVTDDEVEIIQQNPGPFGRSRETFALIQQDGKWKIKSKRIKGWLRKEKF